MVLTQMRHSPQHMLTFEAVASVTEELTGLMSIHWGRCTLPHRPEQLFDLAADVERYPEFLPCWVAARVRKREGNVYYTDQVVGRAMARQRFRSKTTLFRPGRIDVTSTDGPIRNLHLTWLFDPLPDYGCQVSLAVDLELHAQLIQDLFGRVIVRTVGSVMSAFEARARGLYGRAPSACTTVCERNSSDSAV